MSVYWALFVLAVLVCLVAVPTASRYEARKDRELWERMFGVRLGRPYDLESEREAWARREADHA